MIHLFWDNFLGNHKFLDRQILKPDLVELFRKKMCNQSFYLHYLTIESSKKLKFLNLQTRKFSFVFVLELETSLSGVSRHEYSTTVFRFRRPGILDYLVGNSISSVTWTGRSKSLGLTLL